MSFPSPPARPTIRCRSTAARKVERLSQIRTVLSWPGIRNEGEAGDSRRRNGLIEAIVAAPYQEDLLLLERIEKNSQESLRSKSSASDPARNGVITDRCPSHRGRCRPLFHFRLLKSRIAFAN